MQYPAFSIENRPIGPAIECALAHQDADAIYRAYARVEHWPERVTVAQWWADHLDGLRNGASE
jgi:hypothetical protein